MKYHLRSNSFVYGVAILCGVIYGVSAQLAIRNSNLREVNGVMSFGFVFILPIVLGFLTLWCSSIDQRRSWLFRIFAPWGTISVSLLFSMIIGWEGAICLIMASVLYFPLASLGGVLSGLILARLDRNTLSSGILAFILTLPLLSAFLESYYDLPLEARSAITEIEIQASPTEVWEQIIRVPKITEPLTGFFYRMGFPKPIEATLSYEGAGAIRNASFEGGLLFIETIDTWEPNKRLSFSIASDPKSVAPTTLDEHVIVGGRYFDVLRGSYEILPLNEDRVILRLSSNFRVSTRFNFYASHWAKFLMSDIQQTILKVIKSRTEKSPHA